MTASHADDVERLSREFVLVTDGAGAIQWADARAAAFIGARPGRLLADLCIPGSGEKARQLIERAKAGGVRGWELSAVVDGRPATIALNTMVRDGEIVLVGQVLGSEYDAAIAQVSASMDDIVSLNREIVRQKHEITRYADSLAASNRELQESNRGILALHRELDDRAEALSRSGEIKSRVVSSVSHEFRTPLHSILGITQLLMDSSDGRLNAEQQKQVRYIRSAAEELVALVNDLLDFSKIEAGRVSLRIDTFSAREFVSAMRGSLRPLQPADSPVALVFEDPSPDFEFETDRAKLSQVVRNLVSNALKFTERGEVRVRITRTDDDRTVLEVRDTGVGIPRDAVDDIFEEFSQLDNPLQGRVKGTGLGLPISRRIATLLGGEIAVESTLHEGSTFTVTMPRVHPDATEMRDIEERGLPDQTRVPVLVVEDDRRTIFVYERFLSMAGFRVVPARTVDAARQALQRELPAAIVLDVMLEEETTWRFLADVKRDPRTQNVPVLVVTVTNKEEQARALGADEFWLKPIDQDRLLRKLKSLVKPEHKVRVLVIDDDERARYLIRKHIGSLPYELTEAASGEDGVRLARERMPHVIILDFLLDKATAFDVIDELKADPHTRGIPVIVVTSHVLGDNERKLLAAGTDGVISKQNLSRELAINRIRDALRRSGVGTRL